MNTSSSVDRFEFDPALIIEFAMFELQEQLGFDMANEKQRTAVERIVGLAVKHGIEAAKERAASVIETVAVMSVDSALGTTIDLNDLTEEMADKVRQDNWVEVSLLHRFK